MTDRFKLSLVELGNSYAALVYDLNKRRVVDELTNYADELIGHLHLKRLSIQQEMGYLRVFWAYLISAGIGVEAVTDDVIKGFRSHALTSAMSSRSNRSGSSNAVNATVNAKLVRVYDWLMWLQETERIPANTIGYRNAAVQSALKGSSLSRDARSNKELRARDRYPLLLDDRTRNSKHRVPKFIPTEDTVDALHAHFMELKGSSHIRHRNTLLVDVAAYTGFRRNSIQSLHVDQFMGSDFTRTDHDTVIIRPLRQKFDYGDTYEIPLMLHDRVRDFIQTHRHALVASKGVRQRETRGAVFISERTCRPLDDRSITSIISKAMRACGAPKGTAIHSFRAKFLVEAISDEYADRRTLGLDTSEETITRAVARKAGQRNPMSLRPYISGNEASLLVRNKADQRRRAKALQEDNDQLREQVSQLQALLRKSEDS